MTEHVSFTVLRHGHTEVRANPPKANCRLESAPTANRQATEQTKTSPFEQIAPDTSQGRRAFPQRKRSFVDGKNISALNYELLASVLEFCKLCRRKMVGQFINAFRHLRSIPGMLGLHC